IEELYLAILRGFEHLAKTMGEEKLFVGRPSLQVFGGPHSPQYLGSMNDLNQYGLDLIAVTNLHTAKQAITMILEQGEGVDAPPAYLRWTHFCLFTQIRQEMEDNGLGEIAARPAVRNPMLVYHPDVCPQDEVTILTNHSTRQIAALFNGSYELMLLLLLYLYSDNVKTRDDIVGLMDAAFFPLMTMFVRPLAEILTEIPAFATPEEGSGNAGPGFELNGDVLLFPSLDATWTLFQERIDALVEGFRELLAGGDSWIDLPGQREENFERSRIYRRLETTSLNMARLALDWASRWQNIGTTG
ncbi:MAG: ferritin-like protein, partial [Acidobacteriota bacterium]|nr:ferritin-like protein [Acidobacteriota bacterium]